MAILITGRASQFLALHYHIFYVQNVLLKSISCKRTLNAYLP